jgi:hypothetical protein
VVCTVGTSPGQSTSSFLVEVTDDVPPEIKCPDDMDVAARNLSGAIVTYSVTATDDCTPQPRIRCSPPSGSVFPVGETRVMCEAADDSGNLSRCVFVVTVQPPPELQIRQSSPTQVELRWVGEAIVEGTDTLNEDPEWKEVDGRPVQSGEEWTLELPASDPNHFFRLRSVPLLPPADRDGDGVPDERDRCPDTPPGLPVDEFGCSPFDLVASPDRALGPEQAKLRTLRKELLRWPSVADLAPMIPDPDGPASNLPAVIFQRDLPRSLMEASNVVRQLDAGLMAFVRTRALRELEILKTGPVLYAEHADVRNEDHEMMDLERIEEALTESLNQHQRLFLNLSNIVRSTGVIIGRQQLQIESIDSERGIATLSDGRRLLLPKPGTPGAQPLGSIDDALAEGSIIDAELSVMPDGSLYGNSAASASGVSSDVIAQVNPSRLALRVTPVDFGLPSFDLAPRHQLKAYKWGFTENLSRHSIEFYQALAAVKLLNPNVSGDYKHWLKVDYDANNDGVYGTLVNKLDETTPPFVLKSDVLPVYKAFNIRVREYRAKVVGGVPGPAEVIGEEIYLIELNPPGTYAQALYDQTVFDLADSPSETGHGIARVNDIARRFPLTLKPLNEMAFSGASYKATGNSSSYPSVLNIGFNDPFAVHFRDPNADLFFSNPDDFDKGIYGPRLKGLNNNKEFHYRVALPFIARDRLHDCSGSQPDTFYRIPLAGIYSVSQGNNGQFTHNGWQRFAWDFPKSGGTTVLAARGGVVISMRESSSQSCWNANAQQCQNCSGAASPNFVNIRHRDGTIAWYGHFQNNKVYVSVGQRVYRGTSLGGVGTTGCSTGNHLHLHVVNPEQTTTVPLRFESFLWPIPVFQPCYLPPSNSQGFSTNP